jgi:hypothetical protein
MKTRQTMLGLTLVVIATLAGCLPDTQQTKDAQVVEKQQEQYTKAQPVPMYDWSLERDLLIKLYDIRNAKVATHSVWRSDYGMIEGDCPSMGYGLPYDTSLTNPLVATNENQRGTTSSSLTSIGQPEPNGVFASTNTSATWVMCVGQGGIIEPHYVESKVTVYPGPVTVDYEKNRVVRAGKATVTMTNSK